MAAKLISYSNASNDLFYSEADVRTLEGLIGYCARVSNPENQELNENSEKLIKYLIKHKHWSPLEMVNVCLEIETTRDIARQIIRHRSFSFQEFSQRYADPTEDLKFVYRTARLQDPKNRQNSIDLDLDDYGKGGNKTQHERLAEEWNWHQKEVINAAKRAYKWARDNNIAKEQARAVLPEGNTVSRLYMNGTLRSWVHYIELRKANGTQKEHVKIAEECLQAIMPVFSLLEDIYV